MRGAVSRAGSDGAARLIRIAAVGDVHVGRDAGAFAPAVVERLGAAADLLLLAGDLTQHGFADESVLLAHELRHVRIPVIAVLGNHDYHQGEEQRIRSELERAGVIVLEGEGAVLEITGVELGIAGVKGFGGGFPGACGTEFGEDEMKAFMRHSRVRAEMLGRALDDLRCDLKVALTHYAPARGTLAGEPLEIFPFLGSYFLGQVVDAAGCAAAFHGHAHSGTERALTPAGIPVRNVARPVIRLAYKIYTLSRFTRLEDAAALEAAERVAAG